jgi:hypothetical protein
MENVMPWLLADYHPVSFFSLRPAHATTSGGQTLLTPTAFALKMALLGAAIQTAGLAEGRQRFPVIRDLAIAVQPPDHITVLKSFAKIRRPIRLGNAEVRDAEIAEALGKGHYPFAPTIAYRELVQFGNPLAAPTDNLLRVAFASPAGEPPAWLGEALLAINYFGKRGGFMQLTGRPSVAADLPPDFTPITQDTTSFDLRGTLQMLDDCGPTMTFEHADIYSPKRIALGKERILRHVVLPYRLARSSRGYSLYQRLSPTDGR